MQTITTIGLDIAKSVFQVHCVDANGDVVLRRQLKRRYVLAFFQKLPPCLVGIEACASSHHWSRQLQALGYTVRLMPPAYVKPYVKRQKNDAADAEAICEAVTRPNMRFVPTKTPEQQSCLMLHRTRHLFIRQQTAIINSIRAHLAESCAGRAGRPIRRFVRAGSRRRGRTMASSLGKMPTTSVRRLIAPLTRSSGLVECSLAIMSGRGEWFRRLRGHRLSRKSQGRALRVVISLPISVAASCRMVVGTVWPGRSIRRFPCMYNSARSVAPNQTTTLAAYRSRP
jgi:transposase